MGADHQGRQHQGRVNDTYGFGSGRDTHFGSDPAILRTSKCLPLYPKSLTARNAVGFVCQRRATLSRFRQRLRDGTDGLDE